jgi:hypothetical protein
MALTHKGPPLPVQDSGAQSPSVILVELSPISLIIFKRVGSENNLNNSDSLFIFSVNFSIPTLF